MWSAYNNVSDRLKQDRSSKEQELHAPVSQPVEQGSLAYRIDSLYPDGSGVSDPFLSFGEDLDFGPDCEQFRIRDLGDFTDRFDRTAEASPSRPENTELEEDVTQLVEPTPLMPGKSAVELSEPSALLSDSACRALAAAFPLRHRWRRWVLLYSSGRHGISLQTLYRCHLTALNSLVADTLYCCPPSASENCLVCLCNPGQRAGSHSSGQYLFLLTMP